MRISSKNQKIVVFSDPHQEVDRVAAIIRAESPDLTVCLGDWFDSFFYNSIADIENTCSFLRQNLFEKNFITLMGNHDIHYLYDNPTTICSGYERGKKGLIQKSFSQVPIAEIRKKFAWYIWIDDYLCTHAGIHPIHIPARRLLEKDGLTKDSISEFLDEEIRRAEDALISGDRFWLYGAGMARGGRLNYGGIIWLDFNQEFEPIPELRQIVGHTSNRAIRNHPSDGNLDLTTSDNLCIDCRLKEYLVIENGKLKICKFCDL